MLDWNWLERNFLHITAELSWNFFQHFLSQVSLSLSFGKPDELDNVSLATSSELVLQGTVVSVELVHTAEVCIANTDDDD